MRELSVIEITDVNGGIGPAILLIPAAAAVGKKVGFAVGAVAVVGAGVVAGVAIGEGAEEVADAAGASGN